MTIHGEVYTTIRAEAVNAGISTMAVSGSAPISGDEYLTVVIRWAYDPNGLKGISGVSWFCDDDNGPITGYYSDEEFNAYLDSISENEALEVIEGYMNSWQPAQKEVFWSTRRSEMHACLDIVATSSLS